MGRRHRRQHSGSCAAIAERIRHKNRGVQAAIVVEGIETAGGSAVAIQADVSALDAVASLVERTLAHWGRLDIFVANAGRTCFKPLQDIDEQTFDQVFALNAKGTFFCLQAAARHLADGGRIVCVSTIGTVLGLPGGACYFGSKAAVEQFCRVLGRELAPRGITVNVVSPGFTATRMLNASLDETARAGVIDMTPLGRIGQANEVADVIAFLASDDARWVTRQNLAADGGVVAR